MCGVYIRYFRERKFCERGTFFQAFSFDTSKEIRNPTYIREYRVSLYNKVEKAFVGIVRSYDRNGPTTS